CARATDDYGSNLPLDIW
nr:immunoglobulin heavy chain junction region [Macaca mulatta]